MEITFSMVRSKEVVNLFDGKRLGHIYDVYFDKEKGSVLGFAVPGIKKMFKKAEDIFIPLENIKKIGDDVILVRLAPEQSPAEPRFKSQKEQEENRTYLRFRRTPPREQ